ncbi:MAG: guanylate kinase [Clostridia bacterium]|nr:guanylate kinase [Clostridia bacterium]
MRNKPGLLIVLSGPSGSGKGTILKQLLARRPQTVVSISATTRAPRPGEEDGVQYFFRTREEFEGMIARGELLEYAEYNGNYYGTPAPAIDRWLEEGKDVVLEIEVQGAEKVIQKRQDLVSIFIGIPSLEELEHRLRGRGTEAEEAIRGRMAAATGELHCAGRYQYLVMNDEVELAVQRIEAILTAEKLRFTRMENEFLEVIKHA